MRLSLYSIYSSQTAIRRRAVVLSRLHDERKVYGEYHSRISPASFYIKSRANREARGEIAAGHARSRPSLGMSAHRGESRSRAWERHVKRDYVGMWDPRLANLSVSQLAVSHATCDRD